MNEWKVECIAYIVLIDKEYEWMKGRMYSIYSINR